MLWLLVLVRSPRKEGAGNLISSLMLFGYAAAFSFAYVSLSTGTGALILFSSVQVSMLAIAIFKGDHPRVREWLGLLLGLGGLVYLVLPGLQAPPLGPAALMALAGVARGIYSWRGKGTSNPAAATAWNFVFSVPLALLVSLVFFGQTHASSYGVLLAVVSGALTSGLGYVAWYAALAHLSGPRSAIVQLSVPILAGFGGILFLGEELTIRLAIAAVVTLGGVALSVASKAKVG